MANYPYMPYQPPVWSGYAQTGFNMPQNGAQTSVQAVQTQGSVTAPPVAQNGFVCRPVASEEEGKAVPTDFTGLITIMPDFSHGAIYTKILDPNTGSSVFRTYRIEPEQETAPIEQKSVDYAPFFDSLTCQLNCMNDRFDELMEKIETKPVKSKSGKAVET